MRRFIGVAVATATLALSAPAFGYGYFVSRVINSGEYVGSLDYRANSATFGYVQDTAATSIGYEWSGGREWAFGNGGDGYNTRWLSSDVLAHADLGSGALKTRAVIDLGAPQPGSDPLPAPGTKVGASASASAAFGDTLRFVDGAGRPWSWSPGERLDFNFSLDGRVSIPSSYAMPGPEAGDFIANLVRLSVYRAGAGFAALEASLAFRRTNPDYSDPAVRAESDRLSRAIDDATIARAGWIVGDSRLPPDWYTSPFFRQAPLDASGQAVLSYSLDAPGDIEFVLDMSTRTLVDMSYPTLAVALDYSHTLQAGFTTPAGVRVQSGSGVFPGTTPIPAAAVPEPATGLLALLALGTLAPRRRAAGAARGA